MAAERRAHLTKTPKQVPVPDSPMGAAPAGLSLPQLILLDEATLVFIQDVEHLLHIAQALLLQADHLEEPFVVKGVGSCGGVEAEGSALN